ncbi:MAG: hypothetical protein AB7S81_08380 [Bdellovibrionales bacterium]
MPTNEDIITLTLTRKEAQAVRRALGPFAKPYKQDEEDKDLPFADKVEKDMGIVRIALIGQLVGKLEGLYHPE